MAHNRVGGMLMTIHHDKLAYGKLASLTEEFSEEQLLAMVNSLSSEEEEDKPQKAVPASGGESKKIEKRR